MKGAVNPARISKFLPSKVINRGMYLYRNNHNNTISTKTLTIWSWVRISEERLSINFCPLLVTNKSRIVKNGGATRIINLGGI
jgi:hypothetical protein